MVLGYFAVRGAFAHLRSSFYYETHVLTINGIGLLMAGLIGFAYACYLYKCPPDGGIVRLKDPNCLRVDQGGYIAGATPTGSGKGKQCFHGPIWRKY